MKISVLLPVYNEAQHITACLAALRSQRGAGADAEIIVIDGGSTDATLAIIERARVQFGPRLQLLKNPRRTTATGLNLGLAAATGDIIARVDGHSVVPDNYLDEMAKTLADPAAWVAGAVPVNGNQSPRAQAIWAAMVSPFGCGGSPYREPGAVREVESVQAAAYRREAFDRVGKFDAAMNYAEDDELNYRVRRAGGKIILRGDLSFTYFPRATYAGLMRQMFNYGGGRMRMILHHPKTFRVRHLLPLLWLSAQAMHGPAAPVLLMLWALYLLLGLWAVARRGSPRPLVTLLAFPVMHFAYGVGFIWAGVRGGFL